MTARPPPDHPAWVATRYGEAVDLLRPEPETILFDDVAHSLARLARFNGHADVVYSVAEHCVRVHDFLLVDTGDAFLALAGLLHDAAEAYTGDLVWPMKQALPPGARAAFDAIGSRLDFAIAKRAALFLHPDASTVTADTHMAWAEAVDRDAGELVAAMHGAAVKAADLRALRSERDALSFGLLAQWPGIEGIEPLPRHASHSRFGWKPGHAEAEWLHALRVALPKIKAAGGAP